MGAPTGLPTFRLFLETPRGTHFVCGIPPPGAASAGRGGGLAGHPVRRETASNYLKTAGGVVPGVRGRSPERPGKPGHFLKVSTDFGGHRRRAQWPGSATSRAPRASALRAPPAEFIAEAVG